MRARLALNGARSLRSITDVDNGCRLSIIDAYHVLNRNLTAARLGKISSPSVDIGNQRVKYLEHLTSLTIDSNVDLHALFSKLSFTKEPEARDTNHKHPAFRNLSDSELTRCRLNPSSAYDLGWIFFQSRALETHITNLAFLKC